MNWLLLSASITLACAGCATTPEVSGTPAEKPPAECLPPPPPPPGDGTTPLDKQEVLRAMSFVKPCALECYRRFGQPGVALVSVEVDRNGAVHRAEVTGALAGSPTAECVADAVRKARFRAASAPLIIQYPFILR